MHTHSTPQPLTAAHGNTVRALGNVGVCIASGGKKVIVDALNHPRTGCLYRTTAPVLATAIVQGSPPLDADLMLITHYHHDHFCPDQTAQFMRNSPLVPVCSCPQVATALPPVQQTQGGSITVLHPPLYGAQSCVLAGVPITAVSLEHMGKQYAQVTNLGFIIALEKTYVHTGDAAPTPENMHALAAAGAKGAVLIAPFPYLTLPKAFALVQEILAPRHLLLTHLPLHDGTENGPMGWLRSLHNALKKQQNQGIPLSILENENAQYTVA